MDELLQLLELVLRLLVGLRYGDKESWHDFGVIRITSKRFGPALNIGIERLRAGQRRVRCEDDIRRFGCQVATIVGSTGLHNDRPALRRGAYIKRPFNTKIFTFVVERV